jgi:hypothetical protein
MALSPDGADGGPTGTLETMPLEAPTPEAVTTDTVKKYVVPLFNPVTLQVNGGGVDVVIALAAQLPALTGANVPVGLCAIATW